MPAPCDIFAAHLAARGRAMRMTGKQWMCAPLLWASAFYVFTAASFAAEATDAIQPNTNWKGEIRQDSESFPAVISIRTRNGDRIEGEVDFTMPQGIGKLVF